MILNFLKAGLLCVLFFTNVSFNDHSYSKDHVKQHHASPLSNEKEVKLKITYKINVEGHIDTLRIKMIIPADIKDRQTINSLSFSTEPYKTYSVNSNSFAEFKFYDIDESFKIVMKSNITIYRTINDKNDTSKVDFTPYLTSEESIEVENPKIQAVAASLKEKTDIETVMKTFQYVKDHIIYELKPAIGAEQVLESGLGKCMDFSDLFVALLRANKIPAKSVFGLVVYDDAVDNPRHAWSEAYLQKQGWIRFDATSGHSAVTRIGKDYVMRISNKYITLSEGRNDPELRLSMYRYSYKYGHKPKSTGRVTMKCSFDLARI